MTQVSPAKLLEQYQKQGYNILTPSITLEGLSPHHHATVETVTLSPILHHGDVYPHKTEKDKTPLDKQQFRITKQGLDKLSMLAGVIWHQEGGSKRLDDGMNRDYVAFEAFGAIRKADGQLVPVKAFYDLDFIIIEEDLRIQYRAKGGKPGQYQKKGVDLDEYVDFCTDRDMRSKRRHRATLCESGAKNRVIRSLLGIRKVYTGLELKSPFVCVRVTYQPDYDDPAVKQLITLASLGAMNSVYGLPSVPVPQLAPPAPVYETAAADDAPEDETIDMEPNGVDEEPLDAPDEDYENWDVPSMVKHINYMARAKAYDLAALITRMPIDALDDFTRPQLLSLINKLNELPVPGDDGDIPF